MVNALIVAIAVVVVVASARVTSWVIVGRLSKGAGPTTLVHLSRREVLSQLTRNLAGSFVLLCAEKTQIADDE